MNNHGKSFNAKPLEAEPFEAEPIAANSPCPTGFGADFRGAKGLWPEFATS